MSSFFKGSISTDFSDRVATLNINPDLQSKLSSKFSLHLNLREDLFHEDVIRAFRACIAAIQDLFSFLPEPFRSLLAPLLALLDEILALINKIKQLLHCPIDAVSSLKIHSRNADGFNPKTFTLDYNWADSYPKTSTQLDTNNNWTTTNREKRTSEQVYANGSYNKTDKNGNTQSVITGNKHKVIDKNYTTNVKGVRKVSASSHEITGNNKIIGDLVVTGKIICNNISDSRGNLTNFKTTDGAKRA